VQPAKLGYTKLGDLRFPGIQPFSPLGVPCPKGFLVVNEDITGHVYLEVLVVRMGFHSI